MLSNTAPQLPRSLRLWIWRFPARYFVVATLLSMGVSQAADELGSRPLAFAQSEAEPATSKSQENATEAERKALAFIKEHQPRLISLMNFLKAKQPAAYQKALREMARSQQRLEGLAKRDPELYEIELQLWQIRSRLRLLAAKMSVAKDAEQSKLSDDLVKLVEQEAASDLGRLRLLRERAARQIAKLDEDILRRTDGHEELVAKSLKGWQNRIKKSISSSK